MPERPTLNDEIRELDADGAELRFADPKEARKKAMDYLARREYGQAELRQKLAAGGFTREAAERAVGQLAADGLQDDRRFAESFVQSRIGRGKGPQHIRAELGQRGLSSGLIDEALVASGTDWYALAREVRVKKFGKALPVTFKEKARQMRFLQYRGFSSDQVQAACGADD